MHVRVGDQEEVYLVTGLSTWEIDPHLQSWMSSRVYWRFPGADSTGFTLENQRAI